ncbi:S-layer homology domain-containing protein [Paenibacillus nanensis]|uniref:S-layer homology domain-containing protein n=1 Tax=Paenibacillus nanensis TaxID=393251 RepID=A0A3A1URY0_9BACL|nr:S-layer homology domain-containing protein [Paenibacillus nanensis]RIX45882.1 S-layer homology domain-containing protein [Paenibacillus nanensis]
MKLSKKLAVTTIAASVAMSAFAGIPLSNKGLAEKLGFDGVAYAAAASFPNSTVTAKVTQLRDALIATDGIDEVRALRVAINNLSNAQKEAIANPIVEKFMKDIPAGDQPAKIAVLKNLFVDAMGIAYDPSLTELEALRLAYTDELNEYAAAAGVTNLTVDDIANYFLQAQGKVMEILRSKTLLELKQLLTDEAGFNSLLEDVLASTSGGKVEDIFLYYGVTTEDVAATLSALKTEVNDNNKFEDAALALYTAYVYATTPPAGGGGGGGVVVTSPSVEVAELQKKLSALKDKLANATDEEKAKLIAEAVKETQAVVDKLSNLANTVSIVNGKATLVLDENRALAAIEGIGNALKALKEISGEGLGKVKVTINLGNVTVGEVAIGLSDKIVKQAIASGLSAVSLKVGDLTVDLPVGGTFSAAIDFAIKKSDATEETTGELKAASQVYDFNLSIGGQATTSFDQPIVIQIPLGNTEGLDTELLSVAKIVDGKLEFHGGRVEGNSIIESRDTFSSYVVVENKVSFDDVASVEAWAGRAIEVAAAKGAINGKAEGVFDPSAKVTRAEFAKMLIRALDLENGSAKEGFADVNASDWFAPYVAAAAQQGIINGRSATKFDPSANITRAEMATMIARALQAKGFEEVADVEGALEIFSDAGSISDALKAGVAFAASNGIVQGNNGKFAPNDNATRAQAAVIIYNALKA